MCYTPCNTALELWSTLLHDLNLFETPTAYPFYPQTLILFSELHVPDPAQPSPFHTLSWLPWPRLHNPVSDLLIPLLRSQPCIVPHSYKSESPIYCRPSSNIDQITPLSLDPLATLYHNITNLDSSSRSQPSLPSPVQYTSRPLLVHLTSTRRNPGPDESRGVAHKLKPGPSVCTHFGTPRLSGPEFMPPCPTSKELIGVSSNPSLTFPLRPHWVQFPTLNIMALYAQHDLWAELQYFSSRRRMALYDYVSTSEVLIWSQRKTVTYYPRLRTSLIVQARLDIIPKSIYGTFTTSSGFMRAMNGK